jgi:hypothetical protein
MKVFVATECMNEGYDATVTLKTEVFFAESEAKNWVNEIKSDNYIWRDYESTEVTDSKIVQLEESQEPVAWLVSDAQGRYATIRDPAPYGEEVYEPLFAKPPHKKWVGLTDDEMPTLTTGTGPITLLPFRETKAFIRAIEAKLKEKNA